MRLRQKKIRRRRTLQKKRRRSKTVLITVGRSGRSRVFHESGACRSLTKGKRTKTPPNLRRYPKTQVEEWGLRPCVFCYRED